MENITEAMLAALLRKKAVRTVALTLKQSRGPSKVTAWGVEVALQLPASDLAVRQIFKRSDCNPIRIPLRLVDALAQQVANGNTNLWVKLIPQRQQTASPRHAKVKTVVSLDRFITHLRELGARNISIEIHLGEHR